MTDARPRVAFVHIPRTAGTSLGRLIGPLYAPAEIADFYADPVTQTANAAIDRFTTLDPGRKRARRLVKGHVRYGFDIDLSDYRYITMLRRPLDRLTSYYRYVLADERHYMRDYVVQRQLSMGEFLLSRMSVELDNLMVRMVSGADFRSARERVDGEHLDRAKANLRDGFAAFGLSERFETSLRLFSDRLGWALSPPVRVNASPRDGLGRLDPSVEREVRSLNRFDEELYAYAERLFDERTACLEHDAGDGDPARSSRPCGGSAGSEPAPGASTTTPTDRR